MRGGGAHSDRIPFGAFTNARGIAGDEKDGEVGDGVAGVEFRCDEIIVGDSGGAAEGLHPVDHPAAVGT